MRLPDVARVQGAGARGLLVAVLLAACTSQATPSPSPAAPTIAPGNYTGVLRVGMNMERYESFQVSDDGTFDSSWDPQTTWAFEPFELFRCCLLRTLMSYNGRSTAEGGAELSPDLAAEEPVVSTDGLTWTFHLRPDIHYAPPFQEMAISSADFIRALERTLRLDPTVPADEAGTYGPYANFFSEVIVGAEEFSSGSVNTISGLEAQDPLTLVIHLVRPAGDLGQRLSMPAAAPQPAGATDGHDFGYGRYLVASGPYMIEGSDQLDPSLPPDQQPAVSGYVAGTSLTLVRNPSWDRATDRLRSAYVDRIEITNSPGDDYEQELQALLDGGLDVALDSEMDVVDVARLRADSQIASRIHVSPRLFTHWISMNLATPPFDDVHVRRAVNLVANKRALVGLLDPSARVQRHAIPDAFENGLLDDYDPYATVDDSGSVSQAQAEMAQSRYDANGDGGCDDPVCRDILVRVRDDQPEFSLAAEAFAAQLAPLGITLQIERVNNIEAFQYSADPANHAALGFTIGWASDYLNASSWFEPLATGAAIGSPSGGNTSLIGATPDQLADWGYTVHEVPNLDAAINSCTARVGTAQFECWAAIDQYVMERIVPWVPLDNRQTSRLTSANVARFSYDESVTMPALDQIELVRSGGAQ